MLCSVQTISEIPHPIVYKQIGNMLVSSFYTLRKEPICQFLLGTYSKSTPTKVYFRLQCAYIKTPLSTVMLILAGGE